MATVAQIRNKLSSPDSSIRVTAVHKRTKDEVPAYVDAEGLWLEDFDLGWGEGYAHNENAWSVW